MTIGITGSTGFLGANLVRYLHHHSGHRLIPFYSRRRQNPLTAAVQANSEHLDVTRPQEVLDKTRGIDMLFHLAGVVDFSRRNLRKTWEVNVLGTRNVLEAARLNRIAKVICISSINVLGVPATATEPANETNPIYGYSANPISFRARSQVLEAVTASLAGDYSFSRAVRVPYFDSKLAAYELAVEYRRKYDLPVVVVFPGTAVGAGDVGFSITRLVNQVYTSRLLLTLPGGTSFVSAEDACEGMWLAGHKGRVGESYIISGKETDKLSYKLFMELVATVARNTYNKRVLNHFLTIPVPLARGLASLFRLLAPKGELSEGLILSGCVTHRFTSRKAERELGYRPAVDMETAVRQCIDFYHQYGKTSRG